LCFLLMAITSMHAIKIMRNSSNRVQDLPVRKVRNAMLLNSDDSLSVTVLNRPYNGMFQPRILNIAIKGK